METFPQVFITNDRRTIKIGDFGLSREMTSDLPNNPTLTGSLDALERPDRLVAATPAAVRRGERREHMRSVTRGVGTTLYMSPEQRAAQPYDHKVDIYSAGVLLLEMCHPFSTLMERVVVLSHLQRHNLPSEMVGTPEGELILSMTQARCHLEPSDPLRCPLEPSDRLEIPSLTFCRLLNDLSMTQERAAARPSVEALLASPLLAAHGHICVSVHRAEQYALMPLIREQIESVVRVKSFTSTEADSAAAAASGIDLVELEYCITLARTFSGRPWPSLAFHGLL